MGSLYRVTSFPVATLTENVSRVPTGCTGNTEV